MVQCKVMKHLGLLEGRKFDDPDIVEDLEFLTEKLKTSVQDLRFVVAVYTPVFVWVTPHLRVVTEMCVLVSFYVSL